MSDLRLEMYFTDFRQLVFKKYIRHKAFEQLTMSTWHNKCCTEILVWFAKSHHLCYHSDKCQLSSTPFQKG